MKRLICCKCNHVGQKFECRKCQHKICNSCKEDKYKPSGFGVIGRRYPGPNYKKVGTGIGKV